MLLLPNRSHLHIPGSVEALAGDINPACVPRGRKEKMLLFPHLEVSRNWQDQPQNEPLPECTGWKGKSSSQQKGKLFQRESGGLKHSMKRLQVLLDTAGREEPGRLPHIPLFPRRPSSLTCTDSTMQHRVPGVGPLASKAVLLWVDWEHAAPWAASTAIPRDAPFCQGKRCNSTHWEQKHGHHGDAGGHRE